ncbi:MAG: transposase domain-containing protein [Deltaproteobacteria bacterium]|nr:transposase domain-containing protein [Deltaproteobacteria bacterium]
METAEACGLDAYQYLRLLFEKIPYARTEADYEALLPQNITD